MLIVGRTLGQSIVIGEGQSAAEVRIVRITGRTIRLGIRAARSVRVMRTELVAECEPEKPTSARREQ